MFAFVFGWKWRLLFLWSHEKLLIFTYLYLYGTCVIPTFVLLTNLNLLFRSIIDLRIAWTFWRQKLYFFWWKLFVTLFFCWLLFFSTFDSLRSLFLSSLNFTVNIILYPFFMKIFFFCFVSYFFADFFLFLNKSLSLSC